MSSPNTEEPDLPDSWTVLTDQTDAPEEYDADKQPLLRYEHDGVHLWIEVSRRDPDEGRKRDTIHFTVNAGYNAESREDTESLAPDTNYKLRRGVERGRTAKEAYSIARTAARYFAHMFEDKYEETNDIMEAFDYALGQIEEQQNVQF